MAEDAWDFVAIGGGAAGNGGVRVAGELGFKTALIERDRIGGACSWVACVPSKLLLQAAKTHWRLQHGSNFGIARELQDIDPSGALEWVREMTNRLGAESKPAKLEERGVEFIRGTGVLEGPHEVRVGDRVLPARRILIATGSRPAVPAIDGLSETDYLTNRTLFDLPELPRSLLIIGAGPVGMEMAQAFNRLGAEVTVLEASGRVLAHDDAELAEKLRGQLEDEGVRFELNTEVRHVERAERDGHACHALVRGEDRTFEAEQLLIATGRVAEVDELGHERAGVTCGPDGISVNDRLQTSNPDIYAAGDAIGCWQFTHMATIEGEHAAKNALLGADEPMNYDAAGWCTFTDPELAGVGINEAQADERGLDYEVHEIDPNLPDRARIEDNPEGAAKVIAEPGGGRIFGAQILGARAGEIIQEFAAAISNDIPLSALATDVHPYPTLSLAHYAMSAMPWQQLAEDEERLKEIRREQGFVGRDDE